MLDKEAHSFSYDIILPNITCLYNSSKAVTHLFCGANSRGDLLTRGKHLIPTVLGLLTCIFKGTRAFLNRRGIPIHFYAITIYSPRVRPTLVINLAQRSNHRMTTEYILLRCSAVNVLTESVMPVVSGTQIDNTILIFIT